MNARQRRIEKRRHDKRHGMTEGQHKIYKKKRREGYSHDVAREAALNPHSAFNERR